jgi:hypothetical protein
MYLKDTLFDILFKFFLVNKVLGALAAAKEQHCLTYWLSCKQFTTVLTIFNDWAKETCLGPWQSNALEGTL